MLYSWATVSGQISHSVKVTNDEQLKAAVENAAVNSLVIEAGYYASLDPYLGAGMTAKKAENGNGDRSVNCIYAIQESTACFDPVAPETFVPDTATALTFDLFNCGCCPPNDAGVWSVISGPGTVNIAEPTEDTTVFYVNQPGTYSLRYTWPDPWNSFVETEYYFYRPYTASLGAEDGCGLSTLVHFEYSTEDGNQNGTLAWTLNGEPYAGPAFNPAGDTLDFLLTVPSCGAYILEATFTTTHCDPVVLSVNLIMEGNTTPLIAGVGADTTVICPDEPVFSEPTATAGCGDDPLLTYVTDSIPGDCPDSYTFIRTWTAVNDCGDTSTVSQAIVHLPNPNPEILPGYLTENIGDTITAACDEQVTIPFPEITTPCGPVTVDYFRSDGGAWGDPFETGTTEVCYWGVSPFGYNTDILSIIVIVEECEGEDPQFCTLTQGYYGNPGGYYCNGMGTAELLESLLEGQYLVVGSNGNTLTFMEGESACIIALLPGGGPAKKITGANTCGNLGGIQLKKGAINNILLAQTITLGLSLRLSGELGNLEIFSDTLLTAPSSGCGGEGDIITGPYTKRAIPASVYNKLSNNGTTVPTVYDLFDLANTGLGGGSVSGTTLSAISDAVSRFNEGFDECAFGYFQEPLYLQSLDAPSPVNPSPAASSTGLKISPNPFRTSANIEFTAEETGNVSVEVYTMAGVKVAVLHNAMMEAGNTYRFAYAGEPGLNFVTYIVVVRTATTSKFERMIMSR